MRCGSFYDELAELNNNLYFNYKKFKDYIFIDEYTDNTGIFIALYQKDNEYIFAVRDTDPLSWKDWQTNRAMEEGKIPKQFYSAKNYFKTLSYNPIIFTGYSLGGSIAQMLGNMYGNETVCYEPYGTKNILKGSNKSNIRNFGNLHDWVFTINFDNQVGECYIMTVNATDDETPNWYWHQYGLYGKPSSAKKYSEQTVIHNKEINTFKQTNYLKDKQKQAKELIDKYSNEINNQMNIVKNQATKLKQQLHK